MTMFTLDSIGLALGLAAALAVALLAAAPAVSAAVVRFRARRLPESLADRLGEEWLAELDPIDGRAAKLAFAFGLLLTTNRTFEAAVSSEVWVPTPDLDARVYTDSMDRIFARLIDAAIQLAVALATYPLRTDNAIVNLMLIFVIMLTTHAVFDVYCVLKFGGSPGKILMKLRIVTADGGPLTARHAVMRISPWLARAAWATAIGLIVAISLSTDTTGLNQAQGRTVAAQLIPSWLLSAVSAMFSLFAFGDLLAFLTTDHRRSLRDIIAGTVVIMRTPKAIPVPQHTGPLKSTSMFQ
jgi:uncharacterized RDD family membrane protein YckC